MRIGLVRELTAGESRVALTPYAVYELAKAGHRVFVEAGAGEESALWDEEYAAAGARIWVDNRVDFSDNRNLIVAALTLVLGTGDFTLKFGGFALGVDQLGTTLNHLGGVNGFDGVDESAVH